MALLMLRFDKIERKSDYMQATEFIISWNWFKKYTRSIVRNWYFQNMYIPTYLVFRLWYLGIMTNNNNNNNMTWRVYLFVECIVCMAKWTPHFLYLVATHDKVRNLPLRQRFWNAIFNKNVTRMYWGLYSQELWPTLYGVRKVFENV